MIALSMFILGCMYIQYSSTKVYPGTELGGDLTLNTCIVTIE